MKKIVLSLSIVVSLFAGDKLLTSSEARSILKESVIYDNPALKQLINKGTVKVKGVEKQDFYIITIQTPNGSGDIFITKDKKYTIIGRVINNKTKEELKPKYPFTGSKKTVENGIMFTFGKGKKDLYLVTDPECPFCRMMEAKTKDNLEKNYRVHVILFPLSFHKDAKAMSYYILSAKTNEEKAKRFKEVLTGNKQEIIKKVNAFNKTLSKEEKEKIDKELANSRKAVMELGARGTPSVYDENFSKINWGTLIPKGQK
ncbi:MAG: thioredoxin fold domain-containing protein [Nautiliaceae bacterium]|jgi:thiol:disulfide interchange protein DsbC